MLSNTHLIKAGIDKITYRANRIQWGIAIEAMLHVIIQSILFIVFRVCYLLQNLMSLKMTITFFVI